jgi:hypothetical protein
MAQSSASGVFAQVTARADPLTKHAKDIDRAVTVGPCDPAHVKQVSVDALDRLGYYMDPLLLQVLGVAAVIPLPSLLFLFGIVGPRGHDAGEVSSRPLC